MVILFVRMWVEISSWANRWLFKSSSSSWGCELKYDTGLDLFKIYGHPLREDVSWNILGVDSGKEILVILFVRMWVEISIPAWAKPGKNGHPLREDVSWNIQRRVRHDSGAVILFVRMWVEMPIGSWKMKQHGVILFVRMWVEMPCGPVAPVAPRVILFVRMWVEILILFFLISLLQFVILFVRMWVEILCLPSSSLLEIVILFVRMWVEIRRMVMEYVGREGHPLREDVSWNKFF